MGSLSVWHWLLPALLLAIPLALAAEAIRRARTEGGAITPGFKGWLFLLAATVWFTPLRGLVEIARLLGDTDGAGERFPWLVRADLAISAVTVALTGLCLVLMLRRAAAFRIVFPFVAGWVVLNLPLSILLARFLLSSVYGVRIGLAELFAALAADIPPWIGGLVATLAWVLYVRQSRRVAITFVR
jgi:hypothetical protein